MSSYKKILHSLYYASLVFISMFALPFVPMPWCFIAAFVLMILAAIPTLFKLNNKGADNKK